MPIRENLFEIVVIIITCIIIILISYCCVTNIHITSEILTSSPSGFCGWLRASYYWKLTYLCNWGVNWSWMVRVVWPVRPSRLDWLSVTGTWQGSGGTDVLYLLFYYVIFSIQPLLVYVILSLQLSDNSLHYSFKFYSIFKMKCQN